MFFVVQMKSLRLREVKCHAQGHRAKIQGGLTGLQRGLLTPCEEAMSAVAVKLLVRGSPPGHNVQAKVWRSLVQLGPLADTPDWSTQQKKKG